MKSITRKLGGSETEGLDNNNCAVQLLETRQTAGMQEQADFQQYSALRNSIHLYYYSTKFYVFVDNKI